MKYLILIIGCIAGFFPVFWLFHPVVGPNWAAGIAAFGTYLLFPIIGLRWIDSLEKPTDAFHQALMAGTLEMDEYEAEEAALLSNNWDGNYFVLVAISGNRTLAICSDHCAHLIENGKFPSSKFRIFWDTKTNQTYGVQPLGERILISVQRETDQERVNKINDRDIFDQPLGNVLALVGSNA